MPFGRGSHSTALLTDHYELTMLEAAVASGVADRRAVFEVFSRGLPPGRRYGVLAGVHRVVEAVAAFRFGPEELEVLAEAGVVGPRALERLAEYRFGGSIDSYAEGELYFPSSPVLTVEASFADAVVLETVILSILNHDSAVASAAARMVCAAEGRVLIEMGSRRTHEEAAVAAARAAYLAGFTSTSNLEAGRRWGVPTTGTASHAFILAHQSERAAFEAQVAAQGPGTTLLVDTYDVPRAIATAVDVAGTELGAIRIDSGDLAAEARAARAQLDTLGATKTRVVLSGDLDEYGIEELAPEPVDAYGVGTKVVTGSGAPSASFVYKLVAIAGESGDMLHPVAKLAVGKANLGGHKVAWRLLDGEGQAVGEVAVLDPPPGWPGHPVPGRRLQHRVMEEGEPARLPSLPEARQHHAEALAELPPLARMMVAGPPAVTVTVGPVSETEALLKVGG